MTKKIQITKVFRDIWDEYKSQKHRIVICEGGTGSSKSYSIAQLFAYMTEQEDNATLTIARKTFPALKATAMKDYFNAIKLMGIYNEANHNISDHAYQWRNNLVEFLSVDEPTRIRSRRRKHLWLEEANEFQKEDWMQLSMRTDGMIFLSYNPSSFYHWIYDDLQTRKDCIVLKSNYKDNPFLSQEIIREVEGYKDKDPNYWQVYGLGEKAIADSIVFKHWKDCNSLPDVYDKIIYGLDWGYGHPMALTKIAIKDNIIWCKEVLYVTGWTRPRLMAWMMDNGLRDEWIYPDSEDPSGIQELKDFGFSRVIPMLKGKDSVLAGIGLLQSMEFNITKDSIHIIDEIKHYSFPTIDGRVLNDENPLKIKDDAMDSIRGAVYTFKHNPPKPLRMAWV